MGVGVPLGGVGLWIGSREPTCSTPRETTMRQNMLRTWFLEVGKNIF